MRIDIYHLFNNFDNVNFIPPVIIDILRIWSEKKGWNVRTGVAREKSVNLNTDADVVAFSVYTQTAHAAYRLSAKLREKGKIVILGGPHFRGPNCEEGLDRCDVLVNTICEDQWAQALEDIERGRLEPNSSRATYINDAERRFRTPRGLYAAFQHHKWFQIPTIPTSLGCPHTCEFCNAFMQKDYFPRDIEDIYHDLANIRRKTVMFSDASFGLNKRHTFEMMEAIEPLKKTVLVETTLARLRDPEYLKRLARGGVKLISVGIETLSNKLGKHGGDPLEIARRVIRECHDEGILVQGNFIIGMDGDDLGSFARIYDFYQHSDLDFVFCDLMTPYPNTPLYDRLLQENRIIDTDWSHYNYRHVVFRPLGMTINQLKDGFIRLYRGITDPKFALKKARKTLGKKGFVAEAVIPVAFNFFNRYDVLRKEKELNINVGMIDPELRDSVYEVQEKETAISA